MQYGTPGILHHMLYLYANVSVVVRLGTSGLKVSRIILGCMSYGDPQWQDWVLPEEEAVKHIEFA